MTHIRTLCIAICAGAIMQTPLYAQNPSYSDPIKLESLSTPNTSGAASGNTGATPGTANADDCQLVAINDAARKAMGDKMVVTINAIFDDPNFRGGLDMAATSGGKCVADIAKIWDNLSKNFKIGNGLGEIWDFIKNIDPMEILGKAVEKAVEEACRLVRGEINKLFSSITNLLSHRVDLGPLGNISTDALIRYDGTGHFDINVNTPSTSSVQSYLDSIWN